MKGATVREAGAPATLQDVINRLIECPELSGSRKRDLRSAVMTYGKIVGEAPTAIPMDLAAIRKTLDGVVPMQAKVSRKRWANLRSDIAGAIAASGLCPMLRTAGLELDPEWSGLLEVADDIAIANGLSRFARWASLRHLAPAAITTSSMRHYFAELETGSLVRNLSFQQRNVPMLWNRLVALLPNRSLQRVELPQRVAKGDRIAWESLPASLREETEAYLRWCSVPDPLDENARSRALAPETLRLRRDYIHLAVSAACAAGADSAALTSLGQLVEPNMFRTILRQQWRKNGQKVTGYVVDLATGLIKIAAEWVKAPAEQVAELKALRSRLGRPRSGLTEKNKSLLRKFDDSQLLTKLIRLPEVLWRTARRNLAQSARAFIDLQTALAIDILLHVPLRIENLAALKFDEHLYWPRGKGKPALIVIREDEVKNEEPLEYELPELLSDRLFAFRNEIAAAVIGRRPDYLFVSRMGKRRTLATLRVAIQRTVIRRVGVKITPHQFRHLGAKIHLDTYHGGYESLRQLLGHRSLKTTTKFYAGPDTRRAGRAHADLIRKLREPKPDRSRRRIRDRE